MKKTVLQWSLAALVATSSQLGAVTILLGDDDNFTFDGASDATQARSIFATNLSNESNNRILHSGVPRAFDESGNNHVFGVTFEGLSLLDPNQTVTLEMAVSNWGDNDSFGFQHTGTVASNSFPQILGGGGNIANFFASNGTGTVSDALITLDLTALTLGSTTTTVAESAASLGYLDLIIQDDTTVDFVRLNYSNIPEPSTALLGLLGMGGLLARRRR